MGHVEFSKRALIQVGFISLCLFNSCISQTQKEVLFIGNSLTYYHDMPSMLQEMFNERHIKINVDKTPLPGGSLADHLANEETLEKIKSKHWDFLILQEGTVRVLIPEVRKYKFEHSILTLTV